MCDLCVSGAARNVYIVYNVCQGLENVHECVGCAQGSEISDELVF